MKEPEEKQSPNPSVVADIEDPADLSALQVAEEEASDFSHPRPFVVVSFFTRGTPYREEAKKLIASCKKFNLNFYVKAVANQGHWLANVRWRPIFLRRQIERIEKSIVWIDADGVVQRDPVLFDELELSDFDMAVHYRKGVELLGGTMWFANTGRVRRLMDLWIDKIESNVFYKEQVAIQILLKEHPEFRVANLPPTYTQIFDLMKDAGEPVIEHFQASRRLKLRVGKDQAKQIRTTYKKYVQIREIQRGKLKGIHVK